MTLRFTILGCGASPGVPRIGNDWGACDPSDPRNVRSRCSLLVERLGTAPDRITRILVDTGPDVRAQLLSARVNFLDGVVYTHSHADHLHGIDDLRALWQNSGNRVDVYSDAATKERMYQGFRYCFETAPGAFYPSILSHHTVVADAAFTIAGAGGPIVVTPFRQIHGEMDTLGLRIGTVAYSCDISDVPPESLPAVANLDVWILDALRYKPHPSHFSLTDALSWIARVKPAKAILTHMHSDLDYATVKGQVPHTVEPAYDGMRFEVAGGLKA
jgi:phosphoribosyl 1,2-cyclic phosphate phosphodiesterase